MAATKGPSVPETLGSSVASGMTPGARSDSPALRASGLPSGYTPGVAGYAGGPFLTPVLVTPSDWSWKGARSFVVRHTDGREYRAIFVTSPTVSGYWAVELMGTPSTLPELEH